MPLLCRSSLLCDTFPSVLVCNSDLFFSYRFMYFEQRYITVAFFCKLLKWQGCLLWKNNMSTEEVVLNFYFNSEKWNNIWYMYPDHFIFWLTWENGGTFWNEDKQITPREKKPRKTTIKLKIAFTEKHKPNQKQGVILILTIIHTQCYNKDREIKEHVNFPTHLKWSAHNYQDR